MTTTPEYVYETFIRAGADEVWRGLTSPEFTRRYFYCSEVRSDWRKGSRVVYTNPEGKELIDGEVLESTPPTRLTMSFRALWDDAVAAEKHSRVRFEIEPMEGVCRLRIVHDSFDAGGKTYESVSQGWSGIISSLKSLLETGEPLPVAGNESVSAT